MASEKLTVDYIGQHLNTDFYFTFCFEKKIYALADTGDNIRVVNLKWCPVRGAFADDKVNPEAVEIAKLICKSIGEGSRLNLREHFSVSGFNGRYSVKKSRQLFFLNPGVLNILRLAFFLIIAATAVFELIWFFEASYEWIKHIDTVKERIALSVVSYVACGGLIAVSLFYQLKHPMTGTRIVRFSAMLPLIIVFAYGAVMHPALLIVAAVFALAIAVFFLIRLIIIKNIGAVGTRVFKLKNLLRFTKSLSAAAILVLFVIVVILAPVFSQMVKPTLITGTDNDEYEYDNDYDFDFDPDSDYDYNDEFESYDYSVASIDFEKAGSLLKTESWKNLTEDERLDVLRVIVNHEAELAGVHSAFVVIKDLNSDKLVATKWGEYQYSTNTITIAREQMEENVTDILDTVLHEYRHCLQHYYAYHDKGSELYDEFRKNFSRYYDLDSFGHDKYYSQLVEVDARAWASERIEEYREYLSPEDYEYSDFHQYYSSDINYRLETEKTNDDWLYYVYHNYKKDDTSNDFIVLVDYIGSTLITRLNLPETIDGIRVTQVEKGCLRRLSSTLEYLNISKNIIVFSQNLEEFSEVTLTVSEGNETYSMIDGIMLTDGLGCLLWTDKKAGGEVFIPDYINYITTDCFDGCKKITSFRVDENNKDYSDYDGVIYDKDKTVVRFCPAGKTGTVKIYDGAESLGEGAFRNCENITGIVIPSSVDYIVPGNLYGLHSLTALTVPSTVSVMFSDSLEDLVMLETLTITKSTSVLINRVEEGALNLEDNTFLQDIYFDGTVGEAKLNAMFNPAEPGTHRVTVHCSDGSIEVYL